MIITRELLEKSELSGITENKLSDILQRINGKPWNSIEFPCQQYIFYVDGGFEKAQKFTEEIIKEFKLDGGKTVDFGFTIDKEEKSYTMYDTVTEVYGDDLFLILSCGSSSGPIPKVLWYTMDSIPQAKGIMKKWLDLVVPMIKNAKSTTRYVSILTQDSLGNFRENEIPLGKTLNVDIKKNYMPDLPDKNIKKKLTDNHGGIMIFHGEPGTGKSTYIKYLMETMDTVDFVVIDPATLQFSSEGFKNYLISFTLSSSIMGKMNLKSPNIIASGNTNYHERGIVEKDCCYPDSESQEAVNERTTVYILEDAEKLLLKRNESTNPVNLSNILNITDGIIGDLVRAKFICTFNCDLSEIDEALLRKGRLLQKYEFKPLQGETLDKLAEELGIPKESVPESATLSDLYGWSDSNGMEDTKEKHKIGF